MTNLALYENEQVIYSVSLVSKALRDVVEAQFTGIRVKGEVIGLKRHTSGHIYFALKDVDAVIDAVCWRGTKQVNLLREGLEIIAFGKITTYPGRSKYQMIVSGFEASGEGALLQLLMQLKEKLIKEGLFDQRYKKALPTFPKRIGLITSPTGAVLRDIMHRLRERYPCHVLIKPVLVQGEGAAQQVAKAILEMNTLSGDLRPDVLIVARGGGSLEDLFAFNSEYLVRAAFSSQIPLISAIGHETDFTLLDFVADVRAPTPTAAAELATPVLSHIHTRLQETNMRLSQSIQQSIGRGRLKIDRFDQILKDPLRYLFEKQQRIDDWAERLHLGIQRCFAQRRLQLGHVDLRPPKVTMELAILKLTHMSDRLDKSYGRYVRALQDRAFSMGQALYNLSYTKTLERGFCLAQAMDGKVLKSVQAVKQDKTFALQFKDGTVDVKAVPSLRQQGKLWEIDNDLPLPKASTGS